MLVDINDFRIHKVEELICVKCLQRWIGVFPEGTLLKDIECPKCKEQGFVIATGQELGE